MGAVFDLQWCVPCQPQVQNSNAAGTALEDWALQQVG